MQIGTQVYMLTGRGVLMPGTLLGETVGRNGLTYREVASPQGKIYTAAPDNVYDFETGHIMLAHRRAEEMAREGYEIKPRFNGDFRVFHAKKHGVAGGYIVRRCGDALLCNCPARQKSCTCKHEMAVCSLLLKAANRKRDAGNVRIATRWYNLAMKMAA